MRIFITLENAIARQISEHVGMELVDDPVQADVNVLFYESPIGGVTDASLVCKPLRTVVVAGVLNQRSLHFARMMAATGIPGDNIMFTPTARIGLAEISDLIAKLPPLKEPKRKCPRTIGVVSCSGGVGRTTIAAALANYYNGFKQPAILLDWCDPPNAHFHTNERGTGRIDEYPNYTRIVVDTPVNYTDYAKFDSVIMVVGPDLVQSVEPAKRYLGDVDVIVYNRKRAEVHPEIISQALGREVIAIDDDFLGCQAALIKRQTADMSSPVIAAAIGIISSAVDNPVEEGDFATDFRSRSA